MSRKRGIFGSVLALASAAALAYVSPLASRRADTPPIPLRYPAVVDLGRVQRGRLITAGFEVSNVGQGTIDLDGFRASCSCTKLFTDRKMGQFEVKSLSLGPGRSEKVLTNINVGGEVGIPQSSKITFLESSTPGKTHQVTLTYIPTTTLFLLPKCIQFGRYVKGENIEATVDLNSDGTFGEKLQTVSLQGVDDLQISASILDNPAKNVEFTDRSLYDIARIKFYSTNTAEHVRSNRPAKIVVNRSHVIDTSVILSPVERVKFSPWVVMVPRLSGGGAIDHADFVCLSEEEIVELKLLSELPTGMGLGMVEKSQKSWKFRLSYAEGTWPKSGVFQQKRSEIRFSCATRSETLELNLILLTPQQP